MLSTSTQAQEAESTPQKIYDAKSITLPNAMQVVVVENPRTPAVTHMVWYRVGAADEAIGHSGLAHYLEHLMFKGSKLVPDGDFSQKVKSWGGNDNAFTSWDFTAYFQTVPKDKLQNVMLMEADRMQHLIFTDEEALTERDVIIQERRQRTDSNPSAQLSEAMRAALFTNHPYGRPIIGWDQELQLLTPQSARDFYKKYYAPQNAILVVSGDVDAKDVFEMAANIYGKIDNGGAAMRSEWPSVPEIYGTVNIHHEHSNAKQTLWRKLYRVPSIGQNYNDAMALTIAAEIIGGNTGKLYERFVIEDQVASTTSFYYGGINVDDTTVSIGVTPKDNIDVAQLPDMVEGVLTSLIEGEGITDEDVQQAVSKLIDESVYERDSLTGPAMMLGYQLATGLTLDQAETWIHDLNEVDVEDVKGVIEKYLLPESQNYHALTGMLTPED